tara:strand:+ start:620 stop:880 length:261 start_codon:yes stop_codon:yes gene_type:complete
MKAKQIENYLIENFGECKHNPYRISTALEHTAREFNLDTFKLFMLVIENRPIEEEFTHSYGFHTANGRQIVDTFKFFYSNAINTNQ